MPLSETPSHLNFDSAGRFPTSSAVFAPTSTSRDCSSCRQIAIGCPQTAVGLPPMAARYPPSAVDHPPTAVGYPPTVKKGLMTVLFFVPFGVTLTAPARRSLSVIFPFWPDTFD